MYFPMISNPPYRQGLSQYEVLNSVLVLHYTAQYSHREKRATSQETTAVHTYSYSTAEQMHEEKLQGTADREPAALPYYSMSP